MADKRVITDRFLRSLRGRKPPPDREFYYDVTVPGLDLMLTPTGHMSWGMRKRFPMHPEHPARRMLGTVYLPPPPKPKEGAPPPPEEPTLRNGALTLSEARTKARTWLDMVARGLDPEVEAARERAAARRAMRHTFDAVADEYCQRHVATLANGAETTRMIDREFTKRWTGRPVIDILPEECVAVVRAVVKRGAVGQAYGVLATLKHLFQWAVDQHEFGLTASPATGLKAAALIGSRQPRDRILSDDEVRKIWQAADTMAYPGGKLVQLLLLCGQRLNECARLSWPEIDLTAKRIVIPAERMKEGISHVVPLGPDSLALIKSLPRFAAGPYLFTTCAGKLPINSMGALKRRLDELSGVKDWRLHDARRTMRTGLGALPVEDHIRERVIAHAQPGMRRTYDLYGYEDEKRHCLTLWEARLRAIITPPPPAEVADLNAARKAKRTG